MNAARTTLLLTAGDDLYRYDIGPEKATRLTTAPGKEEAPAFSPDGASVAFVRGGNLFVVGADGRGERALTSDGSADVSNGKLDWIYQEEIYGRGCSARTGGAPTRAASVPCGSTRRTSRATRSWTTWPTRSWWRWGPIPAPASRTPRPGWGSRGGRRPVTW